MSQRKKERKGRRKTTRKKKEELKEKEIYKKGIKEIKDNLQRQKGAEGC